MGETILSLKGIRKEFPGVLALDDISLDLKKGEVHALLGENGAGKSTLIKIISGAHQADKGSIWIDGNEYTKMEPRQAMDLGIEVIYQEFNLVPTLSAAENVFLGSPLLKNGMVDQKAMEEKAAELFASLNVNLDPKAKVKTLSAAHQQIVEIAKAVSRNVKILIMDEPSAPLTAAETEAMFEIVKKLKNDGVTIIFISHRLDELFRITDRVTIMRDGKYVDTVNTAETNREQLISLMVGRKLSETYPEKKGEIGEVMLELSHVSGAGNKDISFKAHKGEILGIAGLVGAGRTELMRTIFGAEKLEEGEIYLEGKKVTINSPKAAIDLGIGLIPEDRKQQGLILDMVLDQNISLASLWKVSKNGILNKKAEESTAESYRKILAIKTPSMKQRAKNLSGGNQQKVVLAKWLATDSKVLIFDEPTRGIDVGAKQEIYNLMNDLAGKGMCILMVSSDMEELLGISDRIVVLYENRYMGELQKEAFSQENVMALASGIKGDLHYEKI